MSFNLKYVAGEAIIFLEACFIGVLFGVFYDVFRVIRLAFKNPSVLVFFEDLVYFILLTITSFTFIVIKNDGYLRAFLLIGELLGLILYFFAISSPITALFKNKVKKITSKFKIRLK